MGYREKIYMGSAAVTLRRSRSARVLSILRLVDALGKPLDALKGVAMRCYCASQRPMNDMICRFHAASPEEA